MPDWALSLFRSGAIAEIAIAVLMVETAILLWMRNRLRLTVGRIIFNAASGIALMLALRAALMSPQNYTLIAVWLIVGFAAHIGDVRMRMGRSG